MSAVDKVKTYIPAKLKRHLGDGDEGKDNKRLFHSPFSKLKRVLQNHNMVTTTHQAQPCGIDGCIYPV